MADARDYFEALIFRSEGSQRFTQSSPVLPDVWLAYGLEPTRPHDLLLMPHVRSTPGELGDELRARLAAARRDDAERDPPRLVTLRNRLAAREEPIEPDEDDELAEPSWGVAFNQTSVVARLWFDELIRCVLPMSAWWRDYLFEGEASRAAALFHSDRDRLRGLLVEALSAPRVELRGSSGDRESPIVTSGMLWMFRLVGTLSLIAEDAMDGASEPESTTAGDPLAPESLERREDPPEAIVEAVFELLETRQATDRTRPPALWNVNRNRRTEPAIYRSGLTVKADAVHRLFSVRGDTIRWAVLDSGIDATHLAFRRRDATGAPLGEGGLPLWADPGTGLVELPADDGEAVSGQGAFVRDRAVLAAPTGDPQADVPWTNQTRIVATYDFTRVRDLLSGRLPPEVGGRLDRQERRELRKALKFGADVDWERLAPILAVPHDARYAVPRHHHGTHVAGILGGDWRASEHQEVPAVDRIGIAPDIELYDLRVLGPDGGGDEFSIMAAMQFIRHLNSKKTGPSQMDVHGVNLSFSILHEVSNFACGRTPVCDEAERLVGGGVVVVAAAGNHGRARYVTSSGATDEGYRSVSITDPGNAQSVITVGATHNRSPHTYGVSYFSSRGPTGDGRRKPDLVAPGEKIYSTVPGQGEKDLDGTSMAAPHVSGAAALLMARNFELVGQPARVKSILCESATDLGREPYFQGTGVLDILRALQSV